MLLRIFVIERIVIVITKDVFDSSLIADMDSNSFIYIEFSTKFWEAEKNQFTHLKMSKKDI